MKSTDLLTVVKHGDKALVRLATRDDASGTSPDWSKPRLVNLYVSRRTKPYRKNPAGQLLMLTLTNESWAEYSPEAYSTQYATFIAEEFRMQILELNGDPIEI